MKNLNKHLFSIVFISILLSCAKDEKENPTGSITEKVFNNTELVFTDITADLYMMEPMFSPDGCGGFFLMDHDNFADHQEILYLAPDGNLLTTGLKPAEIAESLGYEIYAAGFENLGCDLSGGLFFTLYLTADTDDYWIFRADVASHQVMSFAGKDQLSYVFSQTPLGAWYRPFLRSQMVVRPDGNVWLYSNDGEQHIFIFLYYQSGQLYFKWWHIPTPTEEPSYTPLTGLAWDGDILLTEVDAAVVWRCDDQNGVSGFLSLEGFPNTVSGMATDRDGNLHFATNYILNYDISIIQAGYNGEYSVTTSFFTEGIDWLLFGRAGNNGYDLFAWESTAFVESFNRPHVPAFWSFIPDPLTGDIYTFDESNGDIYRTMFSTNGSEKKG
ncbi:MAG: SMP-30/gluconolactonase/LRE family protein, partial [Bacteroidetes bacterium]|nr:SMP-30/gluconolactonase/LRE family protein [Bacteroidota bacterium]